MNCEDLNEVLVDLVDGRLDGAEQRSVERHLEGCAQLPRPRRGSALDSRRGVHARSPRAEGRDVVEGAGRDRRRAGAARPPARDADAGSGGGVNWPVWLGAAAALILATVIGLLPLMNRPEPPHDDTAQRSRRSSGGSHRRIGDRGIRSRRKALPESHRRSADHRQQGHRRARSAGRGGAAEEPDGHRPGDHARAATRSESQPSSTNAQNGLFDALRTKVALLQQTVELINEMRKGNQAEAGRRVQTLSQ